MSADRVISLFGRGEVRLYDGGQVNYTRLRSAASLAGVRSWVLPSADGTSGQALVTDGSGVLSWAANEVSTVWQNVKAHGAVGDGATNDAPAIQAAHDALPSGGGIIFFPPGTYACTAGLVFTKKVKMVGVGADSSVLKWTTTGSTDLLTYNFTGGTAPSQWFVAEDLGFHGNGTSHTGRGIFFSNPLHIFVHRCAFYNFGGVAMEFTIEDDDNQHIEIRNCHIYYNVGGGVRFNSDAHDITIAECMINQNSYFGVMLQNTRNVRISECEFAAYFYGNTPAGATHQPVPVALDNDDHTTIQNCRFENSGGNNATSVMGYNVRTGYDGATQAETANSTRQLLVVNVGFNPVQAANRNLTHVKLHRAIDCTILGCHFEHNSAHAGTYYGIEFGTLNADPLIVLLNNEWDSTLTRFNGTIPKMTEIQAAITLANSESLKGYTAAGTPRTLIGLSASDKVQVGDAALSTDTLFLSTGKYGIGTSSPQAKIEVADDSAASVIPVCLRKPAEAVNNTVRLLLATGSGVLDGTNVIGEIRGVITQATPSTLKGKIEVYVNQGDSLGLPAIQVNDDGSVEIGEAGQNAALNVDNTLAGRRGLQVIQEVAANGVYIDQLGNATALRIIKANTATGNCISMDNLGTADSIVDDSGAKLTAAGVWTDAPCWSGLKADAVAEDPERLLRGIRGLRIQRYHSKRIRDRGASPARRTLGLFMEDLVSGCGWIAGDTGVSPTELAVLALAGIKALAEKMEVAGIAI